MAVRLISDKGMNSVVSHLPGVVASVRVQAQRIHTKAEARLAANRYEGHAQVSLSHDGQDSLIHLDDPAALSIEFGHFHNFSGKYIEGLRIITGAAGLH